MDWIKKHYDRLLLGIFGTFALVSGGLLSAKAFGNLDGPKPKSTAEGEDLGEDRSKTVQESLTRLAADKGKPIWSFVKLDDHKQARLVTANPLVEKAGNPTPIAILNAGSMPLRGVVPNWWLYENNLDLTRDDILDLDNDGDKYKNGEEFGTDPSGSGLSNPGDPDSQPPFYVKMQLVEVVEEKYEIRFVGQNGADLGIKRLSPLDKEGKQPGTLTQKVGDVLFADDKRFKVIKAENEGGTNFVFLEDTVNTSGNPVKIAEKATINRPSYRAKVKGMFTNTEAEVKEGGEIVLPDFPSYKIRLDKIHLDRAADPGGENDSIEIEFTKPGQPKPERASIKRTLEKK